MATVRYAAYIVFGLVPATALGALSVLVLFGSFVSGALGAALGAVLPIAILGILGSAAIWASMFARPNDAIRVGMVCGIGAVLLLLGFVAFAFGKEALNDSWLVRVIACSISSAAAAVYYLVNGGRPYLREGEPPTARQHAG